MTSQSLHFRFVSNRASQILVFRIPISGCWHGSEASIGSRIRIRDPGRLFAFDSSRIDVSSRTSSVARKYPVYFPESR